MDIVIIGGGASGLVAAITASKNKNNKVTLIEKNQTLGKKILATGNGKCNYYNSDQNLSHYNSTNNELIKEIITKENLNEVENFFSSLGIIPKIKNGYYYPFSNQATTIKNALVREVEKNTKVLLETTVEKINKIENKFKVKTNNGVIECDKVIIATGSKASPKTGSTGEGYKFLKDFNHTIIDVNPALVQLKTKGNFLKDWAGIRTDVEVSLFINNKNIKSDQGEIQLTNYGVSGICIFNLSRFVPIALNNNDKVEVKVNFLPFTTTPEELLKDLSNNNSINDILEGILNNKLSSVILNKSSINKNKKYNELSTKEKEVLIENLTNFTLEVIGTNSYEECQVCSGGVPLTEINTKTMESKIVKNLHIVGELLDVDGECGGYNLTFAWVTALLAGKSDLND